MLYKAVQRLPEDSSIRNFGHTAAGFVHGPGPPLDLLPSQEKLNTVCNNTGKTGLNPKSETKTRGTGKGTTQIRQKADRKSVV